MYMYLKQRLENEIVAARTGLEDTSMSADHTTTI